MTSPNPTSTRPDQAVLDAIARRDHRRAEILDGRLPTLGELLDGLPPLRGDLALDARAWAFSIAQIQGVQGDKRLSRALEVLAVSATTRSIGAAIKAMQSFDINAVQSQDVADIRAGRSRLRLYATLAKSWDFRDEVVTLLLSSSEGSRHRRLAMALGITDTFAFRLAIADSRDAPITGEALIAHGERIIQDRAQAFRDEAEAQRIKISTLSRLASVDGDILADMLEDRAELARLPDFDEPERKSTLRVVPFEPAGLCGGRKDQWSSFKEVAGEDLRLIPVRALFDNRAHLVHRFPHTAAAIDTILRDLASKHAVRLRPTLLVGSPGCGKTSLARAIGDALGLPSTIYGAGGIADSSAMGTSAQWHSARPSVALDLIRTSKVANPLVVLDEIDKTDSDRRNGALVDALLSFLEPTTARRYRDLALEVEVDLSWVNWLSTANDLAGVPAPLRDRFRIIEIPDPDWSHVGDLSRRILDDISIERRLRPGWIEPLATDELEVLRENWPGGSIRKLRRCLEVLVDGRDMLFGRA